MRPHRRHRGACPGGFTTMELLIAISLLAIVMTMAIGGWIFVIRGERRNSAQCELDIQVRTASERLRAKLRLSDVSRMVFFPEGPGPYTAISFPMAMDSSGDGLVDMDESGARIVWTRTVIYHIARGTPDRLLRTVFEPRDDSLSVGEREAQLAAVVLDGHARNAVNGDNAVTRTVFSNFFDWSIEPKLLSIDGYSRTLGRRSVTFGSAVMGEATHEVQFAVMGQHPSSTGFKIGLDTLRVSSAGVEYEAEDQPIVTGSYFTSREYMPMGNWGGNHHLLFEPENDEELTLRMPYHRWEERHFRSVGARHNRTLALYDAAARRYSLQLSGRGEAWNALAQTEALQHTLGVDRNFQGHAVRVLIRGDDPDTAGAIRLEGRLTPVEPNDYENRSRIVLRIPTDVQFVPEARIAEADAGGMDTLSALAGTARRLHLQRAANDSPLVVGTIATSETSLDIRRDASYVVSFLLASSESACRLPSWSNVREPDQPFSAVLPGGAPSDLMLASWNGQEGFEVLTNLYALEQMLTDYPATGLFQSQIVDTMHEPAQYEALRVARVLPEGTGVQLQVRTGNDPLLADAEAWESAGWLVDGDPLDEVGEGRYVQFRARLQSDELGVLTPDVSLVGIGWPGNRQLVDIGGAITTGPDYGVFTVLLDDAPITRGLTMRLAIFRDVHGIPSRLVSSMMFEVEPRNTGK